MRAGKRAVWQSGTWAGSGANLVYLPDEKFGVVVLANWDYTSVEGFAGDIIDVYLPAPAPPLGVKKPAPAAAGKKVKVSPAVLDRYAGQYRFVGTQIFTFGREGDRLVLSVPGQKFVLTTLSESEFLFEPAQARIVFQKDRGGPGSGVRLEPGRKRDRRPEGRLGEADPGGAQGLRRRLL